MFLFLKKEDEDKDTDKISVEGAATCFFAKEWETLNHKSPNGKLYRGLLPFFSRYDFLHPVKNFSPNGLLSHCPQPNMETSHIKTV